MIELYEIAILLKVDKSSICSLLSNFFNIPVTSILTEPEFYEKELYTKNMIIGLSAQYSEIGYRTHLDLCINREYFRQTFLNLCIQISKIYNTQVVIGDITDVGEYPNELFIIINPDDTYQKAEEETNGDVFQVSPITELSKISKLISLVREIENGKSS